MTARSPGRPVVRSSVANRLLLLLLMTAALGAAEPLTCRGFTAAAALPAVIGTTGRLLSLAPDLAADRDRQVWFALVDADPHTASQALAHAIGCWWSGPILTRQSRLSGGPMVVRAYPPLPMTATGSEALLRRMLDPWLAGDGGLAVDTLAGGWTATAPIAGQARLEALLTAMADPAPRAPHLLPALRPESARRLIGSPSRADLASWVLDLAKCSGYSTALAAQADPRARAPQDSLETLGEALAALAASGLQVTLQHGCLCVGPSLPIDLRHPAERATVAVLPVDHLSRDPIELGRLASQLATRVRPDAWSLPGWSLTIMPGRPAILAVADLATLHAVMEALEAADQTGLTGWLH